jgi:hypothetical protein
VEPSPAKLAKQYPQVHAKAEEPEPSENPVDAASDGEPDPDNPYDYRHYIDHTARAVSRSPSPGPRAASTLNAPATTTSRQRPTAEPKARARPASKVDPLRQAPRKPVKTAARPPPTVRLDRRASTRQGDSKGPKLPRATAKSSAKSDYYVHSSDNDDEPLTGQSLATGQASLSEVEDDEEIGTRGGGLEIDFGDSPPTKRKVRALALPKGLHSGPISLHSAANSPNSRIVAPRQQKKNQKDADQDEIDFGESSAGYDEDEEEESDVDALPASKRKSRDDDVIMQDTSDAEGDEDVEPMSLGSPAHQQTALDGEEDAEADLDAEFEAEMMQGLASPGDSEEESEAE